VNEHARQKVILALDFPTLDSAFQLAQTLSQVVGILKINIHLFTAEGPSAVAKLNSLGPGIFLDLKFHDIPNTVKGAVASAVTLPGVQLLDLHALGGLEMMRAAAKARDEAKASGSPVPKLLAITILTSMDNTALRGVGIAGRLPNEWFSWLDSPRRQEWTALLPPLRKSGAYGALAGRIS